jgi:hypothetical protein
MLRLRSLSVAAAVCLLACGDGEGIVRLEVLLPDDLDALDGPAQVTIRVEERPNISERGAVVAVSAAEAFDPEAQVHSLPRIDIPFGANLVVIVELVRARDQSVAYYGISDRFDFHRGDDLTLQIAMVRAVPEPNVTIPSTSNGYVGAIEVALSLDAQNAIEALVSNDVTFAPAATRTFTVAELASDGARRSVSWNLDLGLPLACGRSDYCPRQVFVRLVDGEGYLSSVATATVTVDTRAPSLFGAPTPPLFALDPDPGRILTKAKSGTLVTVSFTLSEPSETPVAVARGSEDLAFDECARTGLLNHQCMLRFPDRPIADQTFVVIATVADAVGNTSTIAVSSFDSDATAPNAPDTETPEMIVYERSPWGSQGGGAAFFVRAEAQSVESGSALAVLDEAGRSLGTSTPSSGAGSLTVALSAIDRDRLWVVAIDEAGNPSPASLVRDVNWIGAIGLLGLETPANPHSVELAPSFSERVLRPSEAAQVILHDADALRTADGSTLSAEGRSLWSERVRDTVPPIARSRHGMAYDRERGRAIVFGGVGADLASLADTREWDGTRWLSPSPASEPDPRYNAALVYHAASGKTVLFGGWGPGYLGDTWTWNGARWTQETPAESPSPRRNHVMAYDSNRGVVVLVGGEGASGLLTDTWEWDGAEWTKTLDLGPTQRGLAAMAFDPLRDRMVLFGGVDLESLGDTWELEVTPTSAQWTDASPAVGPTPRRFHTMVFDEDRGAVVMLGGAFVDTTGTFDLLEDAWEWVSENGAQTWRPISITTGIRVSSAGVYDSVDRRVLVFGGDTASGPIDALISIRGDTLEPIVSTSIRPPPLERAAMIFDEASQRTLLFGGSDGPGSWRSDTWAWDGANWSDLDPAFRPPPLEEPILMSGPGRITLIGANSSTQAMEVWEWTGVDWAPRDPPPVSFRPRVRFESAGAYLASSTEAVLFGGYELIDGTAQPLDDTYSWTGTEWIPISPVARPPSLFGHRIVADNARDRLVLFGGRDLDYDRLDEVWEWDGTSQTWIGPRGGRMRPRPRHSHAMVFDSVRSRVLIHGGSDDVSLDDAWEWNGSSWRQIATSNGPTARRSHSIAYDSARRRVIVFGGCQQNVDCPALFPALDDTWELSRDPMDRPAVLVAFDWAATNAPRAAIASMSVTAAIAGRGYEDVNERWGADLLAWDARSGAWTRLISSSSAAPDLETVLGEISDAQRFVDGTGKIRFAVAPTSGMGSGSQPAAAIVDTLEIEVRYRY